MFTIVCIVSSCNNNSSTNDPQLGENYYKANCTACHGFDGKLKNGGASDLSITALNDQEIKKIILEGRGNMPAFKPIITDAEASAIAIFVQNFKK